MVSQVLLPHTEGRDRDEHFETLPVKLRTPSHAPPGSHHGCSLGKWQQDPRSTLLVPPPVTPHPLPPVATHDGCPPIPERTDLKIVSLLRNTGSPSPLVSMWPGLLEGDVRATLKIGRCSVPGNKARVGEGQPTGTRLTAAQQILQPCPSTKPRLLAKYFASQTSCLPGPPASTEGGASSRSLLSETSHASDPTLTCLPWTQAPAHPPILPLSGWSSPNGTRMRRLLVSGSALCLFSLDMPSYLEGSFPASSSELREHHSLREATYTIQPCRPQNPHSWQPNLTTL